VYDPTTRRRRRRSLGHRNQELAIAHAENEARKLRAGVDALAGRPTVAGVLQLYLLASHAAEGIGAVAQG
jgi:hypothetical protein